MNINKKIIFLMVLFLTTIVSYAQQNVYIMELNTDSLHYTNWNYTTGEYEKDSLKSFKNETKIYILLTPDNSMIFYKGKVIIPSLVMPVKFVTIFQENKLNSEYRYAYGFNMFSELKDYKDYNKRYETCIINTISSIKFYYGGNMEKLLIKLKKENEKSFNMIKNRNSSDI